MLVGGGPDGKPDKTDAVDNVDIVDFKKPNPTFTPGQPLNLARGEGTAEQWTALCATWLEAEGWFSPTA